MSPRKGAHVRDGLAPAPFGLAMKAVERRRQRHPQQRGLHECAVGQEHAACARAAQGTQSSSFLSCWASFFWPHTLSGRPVLCSCCYIACKLRGVLNRCTQIQGGEGCGPVRCNNCQLLGPGATLHMQQGSQGGEGVPAAPVKNSMMKRHQQRLLNAWSHSRPPDS